MKLDDALTYDERWGLVHAARHALSALLFGRGAFTRHNSSGQCLEAQGPGDCLGARKTGNADEARHLKQHLDFALSQADGRVAASCLCAQAAMAAE